jgi:hypothetical protein
MDGFDLYSNVNDLDTAYYIVATDNGGDNVNAIGFGSTLGRFGQGAVNLSAYDNLFLKSFDSPLVNIWMGHAFNVQLQQNLDCLLYNFLSAQGYEAQLTFNPVNGLWAIWPGNAQPTNQNHTEPFINPIASGNYTITNNTWHWIETQYTLNTTVGSTQLWIDGIEIWNVSNVATSVSSATGFYSIMFGSNQAANSCLIGYFDDLYILDTTDGGYNTTRLGDCRIETLVPTSDAGPNDGTPLVSGPHYEMVNESQNNDGNTYVSLNGVASQEEVYGTNSLSSIPEYIFGIRVVNYIQKTDGGITYGNAVIRSGSVTEYGEPQQILSGYFPQYGIFELDPNTSNVWVYATANAADVGFTIAA